MPKDSETPATLCAACLHLRRHTRIRTTDSCASSSNTRKNSKRMAKERVDFRGNRETLGLVLWKTQHFPISSLEPTPSSKRVFVRGTLLSPTQHFRPRAPSRSISVDCPRSNPRTAPVSPRPPRTEPNNLRCDNTMASPSTVLILATLLATVCASAVAPQYNAPVLEGTCQ